MHINKESKLTYSKRSAFLFKCNVTNLHKLFWNESQGFEKNRKRSRQTSIWGGNMFLKYSKGKELINVFISPTHCVPLNLNSWINTRSYQKSISTTLISDMKSINPFKISFRSFPTKLIRKRAEISSLVFYGPLPYRHIPSSIPSTRNQNMLMTEMV